MVHPTARRRIPATQRREQMLDCALEMARLDGAGSLTLARVAEASGVSKPIAYQHFGSLSGLLGAMYDKVADSYEAAVLARLRADREAGGDSVFLLRGLCETYIDCNLDSGVLHDDIAAALIAAGEANRTARTEIADSYVYIVRDTFGFDGERAYGLAVLFLGGADRLCDSVVAGRLDRDAVVEQLFELFESALHPDPEMR